MFRRKLELLIPLLLAVGSMLIILGSLFKVMYWPGANIMLLLGLLMELVGVPLLILHWWNGRKK